VPILIVHDEIVLECDRTDVERAQAWLIDCMSRGMASFLTQVPVVVEATAERDWSGAPIETVAEEGAA
jgi:DNA polymerase I-like protein with 3'-5' exonuclease and polymerase domains